MVVVGGVEELEAKPVGHEAAVHELAQIARVDVRKDVAAARLPKAERTGEISQQGLVHTVSNRCPEIQTTPEPARKRNIAPGCFTTTHNQPALPPRDSHTPPEEPSRQTRFRKTVVKKSMKV